MPNFIFSSIDATESTGGLLFNDVPILCGGIVWYDYQIQIYTSIVTIILFARIPLQPPGYNLSRSLVLLSHIRADAAHFV